MEPPGAEFPRPRAPLNQFPRDKCVKNQRSTESHEVLYYCLTIPHELHATDIIRTPGFREFGADILRYAQISRQ